MARILAVVGRKKQNRLGEPTEELTPAKVKCKGKRGGFQSFFSNTHTTGFKGFSISILVAFKKFHDKESLAVTPAPVSSCSELETVIIKMHTMMHCNVEIIFRKMLLLMELVPPINVMIPDTRVHLNYE